MTAVSTTQDRLYQGKLCLEQPVDGYRFGTDTMLLAASLVAKPGERVVELGCGVGAVLLTGALRCAEVSFTGVERDPVYAALAQKNIAANGMGGRIDCVTADATAVEIAKMLGTFDHVMANPPYFPAQEARDMHELRRVAREEGVDALPQWLKAANRLLKPKGSVTFIHSADRMTDLVTGMAAFCGNIRVFPFWPKANQAAKRVIVQGIKGSRAPLLLLPGLVLHNGTGQSYTDKAEQIIKFGQSLWS